LHKRRRNTMEFHVLRMISKKLQIFYSVILFIFNTPKKFSFFTIRHFITSKIRASFSVAYKKWLDFLTLTKSPILAIKNPLPVSIFILTFLLILSSNVFAGEDISQQIYLPIGGLLIFIISSLIAVKVNLKDKVSYKDANDRYKETKVCNAIHDAVNEKLECIPDIKKTVIQIETKIDILLKKNEY